MAVVIAVAAGAEKMAEVPWVGSPTAGRKRRQSMRSTNRGSNCAWLTNHREIPIVVEVVDFNSDLGDFVVLPEKIIVAPGASVEADPMVSRLGVGAAEIPVTMKLRAEGKSDQQVLTLKVVKEETPAAPPPAEGASAQAATNPPPPQTSPPPQ